MLEFNFILSQIFAGIAFLCDLASFQFKKKERILLFFTISAGCLCAHYFLLNSTISGVLIAISTVRFFTARVLPDPRLAWVFTVISLIAAYLTYVDAASFVPLIASIIVNFASFQKSDRMLRQLMMIGTCLWIANTIILKSPVGAFTEIAFLLSNFIGYYRHYLTKRVLTP